MTDDNECIHGMESGCTICSGKDKPQNQGEEVEYAFRAKYEGQCNVCDLPIYIGQQAAKTTGGRVVHEDCAS